MSEHEPDDPDKALAQAIVDAQLMEQTRRYLVAGRRFEGLDVAQLNERWVIAFKATFVDRDRAQARNKDDLASELRLRNLEPPYDEVKEEFAVLRAQLEKIGPDTPIPALDREIEEFLSQARKPKN